MIRIRCDMPVHSALPLPKGQVAKPHILMSVPQGQRGSVQKPTIDFRKSNTALSRLYGGVERHMNGLPP
jgi:hypothetical protein